MKRQTRPWRWAMALASAGALSSCGIFSGKPALPRHAALEPRSAPGPANDYTALVANADVAYFPAERAAFGARAEPSARLLDAFRKNGAPFAIAWDILDANQQPLLDELPGKSGAARQEIIRQLEIAGSGRAREHCRAVLRDARLGAVRFLALGGPAVLQAKLETRERLTAEEGKQLPRGFTPPPGGWEAYAARAAAARGQPLRSYRAEVAGQQLAAEKIVQYFRTSETQGKLLVFLRAEDLEAGLGVPRYVAQKIAVRQLVLDSSGAAAAQPKLVTARD